MATSSDYSFMRRPIWLVGHVVAITAIIGFALLGSWQLQRHNERRQLDEILTDRLEATPVGLDELLDESGGDLNWVDFRPTALVGRYLIDDEVILQARSLDGISGHEVLTPLLLEDGTAVVVDRGWVPIVIEGPPVVGAEPSAIDVQITGYVRQTQVRSGFGPVDPTDGVLERVSRVDIARLQEQIDAPLQPVWIQLAEQAPPQIEFPKIVPPPRPGGGAPHLSYAVQWFAFAAVVAVAYPLLMRKTASGSRAPTRDSSSKGLTREGTPASHRTKR